MPATPTFPILIGGRLRRAEPGRGRPVHAASGALVGYATSASRADVADAVTAAGGALPGWSGLSAYERGRLLQEVAELLDERRDRFAAEIAAAEGVPVERVASAVAAAVDRWLWYAGWTDKITGLRGAVNPVDGPYLSWSAPRPVGVVGALAPESPLGLVDVLAPVLAVGATAVVVAPHAHPLPTALLGELLGAQLPAGVANLLTGDVDVLAAEPAHAGVDGFDLAGAPPALVAELEGVAAERGLAVVPPVAADPGLARLRAWSEVTTVWHPVGQ